MDEFPSLATKQYSSLRNEIRSGDILLCSGNAIFSSLIQKATGSIWSHVGFILRVDAIDRIMILESVESIGVRAIPLSNYIKDYNATGKPYPGRLMLARHHDVKQENIPKLSRVAVDLLGYPYRTEEIAHIAARISMQNLGMPAEAHDANGQRAFICSEYAQVCFQSIGVNVEFNSEGYIAPCDFARSPRVTPLCYIDTNVQNPMRAVG